MINLLFIILGFVVGISLYRFGYWRCRLNIVKPLEISHQNRQGSIMRLQAALHAAESEELKLLEIINILKIKSLKNPKKK